MCPAKLFPEERTIFDQAAGQYVATFHDRPRRTIDFDRWETVDEARGIRLVGGTDLLLEDSAGRREARLLSLGSEEPSGDLLGTPLVRFTILRLWP